MRRRWHEIWGNKGRNWSISKEGLSDKEVFCELKRLDGFDVIGEGVPYDSLMKQYRFTKKMLIEESKRRSSCEIVSIFEVGCGSGANLFLFEKEGYRTGGIDYSKSLIEVADSMLQSDDITCSEAINIATSRKYDVVLSNSAFSYFPNFQYAEKVLDKCLDIASHAIGLIDIHDEDRMTDFIEFRKREIADYEKLYRDLPKLFFPRTFFEAYAKRHDLDIVFTKEEMKGYWNNGYVFDVFLYRNV